MAYMRSTTNPESLYVFGTRAPGARTGSVEFYWRDRCGEHQFAWCPEKDFGIGVNGIIEKMVNEAGSEKILFGTDLPWYSPHYAAGSVLFSNISANDVHNIFHKNAENIFKKQSIELL